MCILKLTRDRRNLKNLADMSCAVNIFTRKHHGKALAGSEEIWNETLNAFPFTLSETTCGKGVFRVDLSWIDCAKQLTSYIESTKSKFKLLW